MYNSMRKNVGILSEHVRVSVWYKNPQFTPLKVTL